MQCQVSTQIEVHLARDDEDRAGLNKSKTNVLDVRLKGESWGMRTMFTLFSLPNVFTLAYLNCSP